MEVETDNFISSLDSVPDSTTAVSLLEEDPRFAADGQNLNSTTETLEKGTNSSRILEFTNAGNSHHLDISNELTSLDNVDRMIQTNHHTLNYNVSEPSSDLFEKAHTTRNPLPGYVISSTDSAVVTTRTSGIGSTITTYERTLQRSQHKERKRKSSRSRKTSFSKGEFMESSQNYNSDLNDQPSSLIQALPLYQANENTEESVTATRRDINYSVESTSVTSSTPLPENQNISRLNPGDLQSEPQPVAAHSSWVRVKQNVEDNSSPTEDSTIDPLAWKHHPTSRLTTRASRTDSYSSNIGSLRPSNKLSNEKGPSQVRSVCHDDPCGAGVACHPVGNDFECVCSDETKVLPHQQCPDIGTVDYTPPAKSMPQGNESLTKPSQTLLLGIVVTLSLIAVVFLTLFYWKRKKIGKLFRQSNALKLNKNSNDSISKMSILLRTYNFASNPNYYTSPPDELPLQSLSVQLILKEEINFIGDLGEGCFGRVYKGEYQTKDGFPLGDNDSDFGSICSYSDDAESGGSVDSLKKLKEPKSSRKKIVAVKVLKELVGIEAEADFMREVEIMSSFRHSNILSLVGVVVADTGGTPWMVFEFMPYGDLAEVLRSCNKQFSKNYMPMNSLSKMELLNICSQVAAGMEYLSLQHFVHRDLACRNCLVGQNLTVKISDFGMSRDVYTCDYYKVGGSRMLPVRWMAPESILYGKFTLESDVWSFGVVLWEVYSFGKQPYYGNSNEEVVQLILQGILLSPCDTCPPLVREIMRLCWSTEPHNRLNFPDIVKRLQHAQKVLLESSEDDFVQDVLREINYSQLSMHDSPEKLTLDLDQYLLPKCAIGPKDEYLTILQG